jgi:hypothetical protein
MREPNNKENELSQLGIGVMLRQLGGNEDTVEAYQASVGKTISGISLDEDGGFITMTFSDGATLRVADDGQSCCESRYMRTDDDLPHFIGAKLTGLEIKEAPDEPDEYGDHEVQFLEVQTDRGVFTMASHNEHNGYYGGFYITLRTSPATA